MKATTNPAQAETEHPPLARDTSGNLIAIPTGTCAWRVCRQTTGRPRVVNGPDQQPLRFPLSTTRDELADMCGADTYRVYALDDVGNILDYVTTVNAGVEPRNAMPIEVPVLAFPNAPAANSDLRYALDAISHMARTNAEAMRSIAESQADWVKAIALAKGLPRNVVIPPPPPDDDDDDDEDDGEPVSPGPRPSGMEAVATMLAPYVPELMDSWRNKKQVSNDQRTPVNSMAHLARIQAQLTPHERKLLEMLLSDPESGDAIAADFANKPVDQVVAFIRRGSGAPTAATAPSLAVTDPAVMRKVLAVSRFLEPAERARLLKLGPRIMASPDAQELAATLLPLSDEAAAEWIRTSLDDIETRYAS